MRICKTNLKQDPTYVKSMNLRPTKKVRNEILNKLLGSVRVSPCHSLTSANLCETRRRTTWKDPPRRVGLYVAPPLTLLRSQSRCECRSHSGEVPRGSFTCSLGHRVLSGLDSSPPTSPPVGVLLCLVPGDGGVSRDESFACVTILSQVV